MTVESRAFVTGPSIIRHLIESQAGTVAKALCECLANSIDAHATRIEVTLDTTGFRIVDDGIGLPTREDILRCFEVLGFEHDDRDRVNGKFGLGRAQAWAFARTLWRTHAFVLDVDIRARGQNYELHVDQPHVAGLQIEGTFYTPRTQVEHRADIEDLKELVRYVHIPVLINGRQVNTPPDSEKWTERTPEAYLRVSATATQLKVYSQGIFVRAFHCSRVGVGGVLVTAIGFPLALNVSRNDVLTARCDLWRRLQARLRHHADHASTKQRERLDANRREHYAQRLVEPEGRAFLKLGLFTLVDRRHVTLEQLAKRIENARYVTVAPPGHVAAETAHRTSTALVFAPETLERFGAETLTEFVQSLVRLCAVHRPDDRWRHDDYRLDAALRRLPEVLLRLPIHDDVASSPVPTDEGHHVIEDAKLTAPARAVLQALRKHQDGIIAAIGRGTDHVVSPRTLVAGRSQSAHGWTDGATYIAVRDELLAEAASRRFEAIPRLVMLIVHEYLHHENDAASHVHSPDFYEAFHETAIEGAALLTSTAEAITREAFANMERKSHQGALRVDALDRIERARTAAVA
jgi:hypothetical protein